MAAARTRFGDPVRSRRFVAIGLTAALHALVLLALLSPTNSAIVVPPRVNLATFDIIGEAAAKPATPKPVQPRPVVPPPPRSFVAPPPPITLAEPSPLVMALLQQAEAQAASGGCDLTAPVQAALQASVDVQQALPAIPRQRLSVANAIAVWDQHWVPTDALLQAKTLDTIRTAIVTFVAAASPECRQQPQGGPRLIYVTGKTATTVLALGSGQWTWQQVSDSANPDSDMAASDGGAIPAFTAEPSKQIATR